MQPEYNLSNKLDHISVCICTFKRPELLDFLLKKLKNQKTDGLFTYSIVVVDNDHEKSAEIIVSKNKQNSIIAIDYYVEPEQNIALARNKTVENARGNFIAFIDDDEYPAYNWLVLMYNAYYRYKADGILGAVKSMFEEKPAKWVIKGKFYETPLYNTGSILHWKNTRTSNVLLRKNIFSESENMFAKAFGRGGEDQDFFRRMIDKGYVFVWCAEAPVCEIIPSVRCKRTFMLKRALLRGKISLFHPHCGIFDILKSLLAISIYSLVLPILLFSGHHIFMKYLIKDFDHIGKILALCGVDVIKQKYVTK